MLKVLAVGIWIVGVAISAGVGMYLNTGGGVALIGGMFTGYFAATVWGSA